MARKKKAAASLEVPIVDRAPDLVASAELAVSAEEAGIIPSLETAMVDPPRRRVTGEELRHELREQRREARLAEKGY